MPVISLFDPVIDRVMDNTHSKNEPNLWDETLFALKVTLQGGIPRMYTREHRSNIFADLFWAAALFVISLVYAGARLQELRSTLTITIPGYQADLTRADALGTWLADHPEGATRAIDGANSVRNTLLSTSGSQHVSNPGQVVRFLALIVDPLPDLISNPSQLTLHVSKLVVLYCAYRFLILHRQWRFNFLLPHVSYAVLSLALWWVYSFDPWLAVFAACLWCFPTICALTALLHELLGDNAWKTRSSLDHVYTAHDLWRDVEKRLYSPSLIGTTFFASSPKRVGPDASFASRGRVYTLLDDEDSEGELEAQTGAFTKLLELNLPDGARRKRNNTPCTTPRLV